MKAVLLSCVALALAAPPRAQVADPLPMRHLLRVPPGGYVDLDSGLILPGRERERLVADLLFDRDGSGFFVDAFAGAQSCRHDETSPDEERWTSERQRVRTGPQYSGFSWFARTDRGAIARITLGVTDPYSSSAAFLQWVLVPPSQAVVVEGPTDLRLHWNRDGVLVSWRGEFAEYLVEVTGESATTKSSTKEPRLLLRELAAGVHQVQVRGVAPDGIVSLPSEIACLGERRPCARGTVELPGRWYEASSGVNLRTGQADSADPDVVFYLYGVYAPGGGVVQLGRGRDVLDGASELPDRGYLPSYGRLDEGDVLALHLADGRHGKLMIEAMDGHDLRNGLRVHYAFLPAGGRHFLPRPTGGASRLVQNVLEISWQPVEGAASYRVTRDGDADWASEGQSADARIPDLARDRFHRFRVSAVDEHGDASDPLVLEANTFSERYRLGRFELTPTARQGYSVTLGRAVAHGSGAEPDADLEVGITHSAGGATFLHFTVPYGGAAVQGLAFGEFPDAEQQQAFGTEIDSDSRRDGADVFLFKTRDGKLVSARVASREHPRIAIDYVLRE